jgi:hypothetical protein
LHAKKKPTASEVDDEKHLIASPRTASDAVFPVASISFLRRAAGHVAPVAHVVTGSARVATIEKNLFRPRMARIVTDPRRRFETCTRLAQHVPVREIVRPESGFHLDQLCAAILDTIAN